MKNKKGFTLIELLAVIVILAIIALIAVPIILNMINNARKNAARSAALGYVDAIEYNNGFAQIQPDKYTLVTGTDVDVSTINIKLKGKKPDSGTVTVNEKGKVTSATDLCFYGYKVSYDGKDITSVTKGCSGSGNNSGNEDSSNEQSLTPPTNVSGPTTTTMGTAVYFDPVSTSTCDSEHFSIDNITNGTSTCYKWNIISSSSNLLTVQMDHNLINKGKWAPSGTTTGPTKVLADLANATTSWIRVPALNYVYDTTTATYGYGIMTCNNGICTKQDSTLISGTSSVPVRTRLITGEEVKNIALDAGKSPAWVLSTNNTDDSFSISDETPENVEKVKWMFANTTSNDSNGATNNAYGANNNGYWTLSPISGHSTRAWAVASTGSLTGTRTFNNSSGHGSGRPVITLPKCVFDGNKCSGWHLINPEMQTWSYYQSSGEIIQNGWGKGLLDLSGSSQDYYFENGTAIKGLKTIDNKTYYFEENDTDGNNYIDYNMVRNKSVTIGNETYTFGSDGVCTSSNCNN